MPCLELQNLEEELQLHTQHERYKGQDGTCSSDGDKRLQNSSTRQAMNIAIVPVQDRSCLQLLKS